MNKKHIHIGVEESSAGYERFIDAWNKASKGKITQPEVHLNFEDLSMLLAVLTPRRMALLKALRQSGPLSIRALSQRVERDYKNVHSDCKALENVDLITRTDEGQLQAPWDVIDAHLNLVA